MLEHLAGLLYYYRRGAGLQRDRPKKGHIAVVMMGPVDRLSGLAVDDLRRLFMSALGSLATDTPAISWR